MRNRPYLALVMLLLLLSLAGCGGNTPSSNPQADSSSPSSPEIQDVVSATGEVRPARWASLSFPVGGAVKTLHVQEGQGIKAGQALIELDAVQLARAVAEAQAALSAAEADLARVKAGPRAQDLAAAEQAVAAARANLSVAQAQVTSAEAEQSRAQAGVKIVEAQVAIAQAGVKAAQAEQSRAQAGASPEEIAVARAALTKAQAAVRLAQAEYDRIGGASNTPQALALEQATLDQEMARAEYERLVSGPRPSDLAPLRADVEVARSQVALAQAQVAQAQSQVAQARAAVAQAQAGVRAVEAQVAQAQATLDRLRAGPTPEEIAVAQAAVTRARESLATARAMLAQTTLVAPFDGTVSLIQVRQGEEVMPGQQVLMLGDLATIQVETTDLDEIDVARIRPGHQVDLTFDALPEKVLVGHVARIAPMAVPGQTATTYKVVVELEETDPALRWGMTAFVDISVR
jgi:HlyD family secretion protein